MKEWMKQIFQVVMVVDDLDQVVENWKNLVEFDQESIEWGTSGEGAKCIYRGKEIMCPIRYATFDLGGVQMKLVEPLDKAGENPYADALKQGGPGIHHIGFYTEAYDKLVKRYAEAGKRPVYEEIRGNERYLLYDFTETTGLKIAPFNHMEGPCARSVSVSCQRRES